MYNEGGWCAAGMMPRAGRPPSGPIYGGLAAATPHGAAERRALLVGDSCIADSTVRRLVARHGPSDIVAGIYFIRQLGHARTP
jgi:hypothetical protein